MRLIDPSQEMVVVARKLPNGNYNFINLKNGKKVRKPHKLFQAIRLERYHEPKQETASAV